MMLAELAREVREGRVAPDDLVASSLRRIEASNGDLNAVVALREEAAFADAAAMAHRIAAGRDPGPLAGLPVLVKDSEDVAGLVTTHGSLALADDPPASADGLVVSRLRGAGAIVVGKTNVPEYEFEGFTANRPFGPTRNPWAPDWSPGGSSGGSGAALAAGMAPIATGSDGGGSVRIPAAFCGLAGLKPTNGVIGRSPIPAWMDFSTKGPMGTSIADVRLLLAIMAGPVAGDPTALPGGPAGEVDVELPRRVFATQRLAPWGPLPAALEALFDAALRVIESDLGLSVVSMGPNDIFPDGNVDEDWFTVIAAEHAQFLGRGEIESNEALYSEGFAAGVRAGLEISIEDYLAARRRRFEHVRRLDELLGADGLLISPTMCAEGWSPEGIPPGESKPGTPSDAYNTQAANVTGHPALSVPAGMAPNGVPFGLQITGPRFRDDLVLAMGEAWERARPWPVAAAGYEPFAPSPPRYGPSL